MSERVIITAILVTGAIALAMLGALIWGPPGVSGNVGQLLTLILPGVIGGFMLIINQKQNALKKVVEVTQEEQKKKIEEVKEVLHVTHDLVNSGRAELIAAQAEATRLAMESTEKQVIAAHAAGVLEGQATGAPPVAEERRENHAPL